METPKQPLNVFFNLDMGSSIKDIYMQTPPNGRLGPGVPKSFKFTHELSGTGDVEMTLCDLTGKQLEPFLFKDEIVGKVQFGYHDDKGEKKASPPITFWMQQVKSKYTGNAFEVSIGGMSLGAMPFQTGQVTGTFDDVKKKVEESYTKQNVITKIIVKPPMKPIYDNGPYNKDSTSPQERQFCKWMDETDWNYLQRLVTYGRSVDDKTGYVMFPIYKKDGVELHIEIPGIASSSTFTYTWPSREGNVIDWIPDIDFIPACSGGVTVWSTNNQTVTGNPMKAVLDSKSTEDCNPFGLKDPGCPPGLKAGFRNGELTAHTTQDLDDTNRNVTYFHSINNSPQISTKAMRQHFAPTHSGMAELNTYLHHFIYAQMQIHTGTLIILGEPFIEPGMTVDLTSYLPNNYDSETTDGEVEHYTSGLYMVTRAIHTIDASGYKTTLTLYRNSPLNSFAKDLIVS